MNNLSANLTPVIVITGTTRGIGYLIANYYLEKGFLVVGCSRGNGVINHQNYKHYQVDVTSENEVMMWARMVKKDFKQVDILVCNVGLVKLGAVTGSTTLESFKSFLDSILISTFLVCREYSKIMMLQKYGRIINIGSIMSEIHAPGTCAYASAKSGLINFTKILAREVASYGITCNIVSPSMVRTDSNSIFGSKWESQMLEMQTIKRPISVNELCHLIDFFSSPMSSSVTGQILHTCYVN